MQFSHYRAEICVKDNRDCLDKSGWNLVVTCLRCFCFSVSRVERASRDFASSEKLREHFTNHFRRDVRYICCHSRSLPTISSRSYLVVEMFSDTRFLDRPEDSNAHLEIVLNPCIREHYCHKSLLSGGKLQYLFCRLQIKPNVRPLLHKSDLSQQRARHRVEIWLNKSAKECYGGVSLYGQVESWT
jgi:hypothetical protein